jgi:hypothetical protein
MNRLALVGIILLGMNLQAQKYAPVGGKIMTKWAEEVSPENVWQEYPRPQLVRDSWMNLNGLWDYALLAKSAPEPTKFQGKILVPFCIESALSGVGKTMMPDDRLWYSRKFKVPSDWSSQRVILNFEAVDWSSSVWVNGAFVGAHKGAYDRFSFDITEYLSGSGNQEIVVAVDDPSSTGSQARGKQQLEQRGIWYTPVSGIWQTVWLEAVNKEASIGELKIVPDIDKELVSVMPMLSKPMERGYSASISVFDGSTLVAEASATADVAVEIAIDNPKLWSPDSPFLYDMKIVLSNSDGKVLDEVDTYFGMRKISVASNNNHMVLHLNNKPLFHNGTLDQGWWPDGLHTPPSDDAMKYDLEVQKNMGFNMIRKHIKVEPDRWFYHCDKIGLMVWQDMPSAMVIKYNEERERSSSIQQVRRTGPDLNRRSESAAQWEWELRRMIDIHYNAPCIVMWVPFNEGWGQYATCRMANVVKDLDPSRLVNAVSGWGLRPCGDIWDIHTYGTEVNKPPISREMASVIGEYGGIGWPVKDHLWNPDMRNWGYQNYESAEELVMNYRLKFDQVVEMKKTIGLSASVYTQTTDVEGEVNGLMTYDRKVVKFDVDTLNLMHSVLFEE